MLGKDRHRHHLGFRSRSAQSDQQQAPTPGEAPTKRMQDVHHLTAHYMAKRDAFVTLDDDDMIRKRADLKSKVGIVIVTPAEAVALARNS